MWKINENLGSWGCDMSVTWKFVASYINITGIKNYSIKKKQTLEQASQEAIQIVLLNTGSTRNT